MTHACNCIGPQRGEPYCPCVMVARGVYKKGGRWVEPERDLGPIEDPVIYNIGPWSYTGGNS